MYFTDNICSSNTVQNLCFLMLCTIRRLEIKPRTADKLPAKIQGPLSCPLLSTLQRQKGIFLPNSLLYSFYIAYKMCVLMTRIVFVL